MKAIYNGVEFEIKTVDDLDVLFSYNKRQSIKKEKEQGSAQEIKLPKYVLKIHKKKYQKRLKLNAHRQWSHADDEWLYTNKGKMSRAGLAKYLSRSRGSIKMRIFYLESGKYGSKASSSLPRYSKIPKGGYRWSQEEIGFIKSGASIKECQKRLHRSITAIYVARKKYGVSTPRSKAGVIGGSGRKSVNLNQVFNQKVLMLLNQGVPSGKIAAALRCNVKKIYDLKYNLKIAGLYKPQEQLTAAKAPEDWGFSGVTKDNKDAVKDLLQAAIKGKSFISSANMMTMFGMTENEARIFLIDVFNQQGKLGYRAKFINNRLVFS